MTCNLIVATVWYDMLFISSALYPGDTCMEASHAWVFFVKLGGIMRGDFFFANRSMMMMPADILKAFYASTKTDFMW